MQTRTEWIKELSSVNLGLIGMIILIILVFAMTLVFQPQLLAQNKPLDKNVTWEYYCVSLHEFNTRKAAIEHYNEIGNDGWELVAFGTVAKDGHTVACFKRRK